MNRINKTVSMGGWACRRESAVCTIENRADEISGKPVLLLQVLLICDLWSVGIVGPWLSLRVRHGLGACEGGGDFGGAPGPNVGGWGGGVKERLQGRVTGGYEVSGKLNDGLTYSRQLRSCCACAGDWEVASRSRIKRGPATNPTRL